jgi:DNA topoisomerase-3
MITAREKEIEGFRPREYYSVRAVLNGFQATYRKKGSNLVRIFDKARAEAIVKKVSGKEAVAAEVKKNLKKEPPPLLYDLTELQRDANRRYGLSAKKTLNIMQSLYEIHKVLTYPRTDSKHISEDIVPTLGERLSAVAVGPYAAAARKSSGKSPGLPPARWTMRRSPTITPLSPPRNTST